MQFGEGMPFYFKPRQALLTSFSRQIFPSLYGNILRVLKQTIVKKLLIDRIYNDQILRVAARLRAPITVPVIGSIP